MANTTKQTSSFWTNLIKKRFLLLLICFVIAIVFSLLIGKDLVGVHQNRIYYFIFFLFFDFLLLVVFYKSFKTSQKRKYILSAIYLFPLLYTLIIAVANHINPIENWSSFLKIYAPAFMQILIIAKFLLIVFLLLGVLVYFPFNIINWIKAKYKKQKYIWKHPRVFAIIGSFVALSLLVLSVIGFFKWTYDYKVFNQEYVDNEIPASFDNFKIVQISDIHFGSLYNPKKFDKAVEVINSTYADIVVFTGDLVNFIPDEATPYVEAFKKIKSKYGAFAILGNHDYGTYSKSEKNLNSSELLDDFYSQTNWDLLKNESRIIKIGTDSIAIIGVENWSNLASWGQGGDLNKANADVKYVDFKVLLSHDPHHWEEIVIKDFKDINLTLAGHTHAMQFGWETKNFKFSPSKWVFKNWAGMYQTNQNGIKQSLYVNRGLGTIGLPIRIGIPSEITVITLKK